MAKRSEPSPGSWLLAEEFYEQGDAAFVDELRRINSPDRLGAFAEKWFADRREPQRKLLLEYLDRPLNAFRHEPLVKRLYKLAEKAGDDIVLASFLVALDRALRRIRKTRHHYDWRTRESWTDETIATMRNSTLPKDERAFRFRDVKTGERLAAPTAEKHAQLRLFSLPTRRYLRRRVWRYFRELGKRHPDRYCDAMVAALCRYTDEDVIDGLALIDNWGLVHVLFHHSPVLVSKATGWILVLGRTLAELAPAPAFPNVWTQDAAPLISVLRDARCRAVRQWTLEMLRRHHPDAMSRLPIRQLLAFLSHEDPEISQLAAEALRKSPELASLSVDEWLTLLDEVNPQSLDVVCELMIRQLDPAGVSLEKTIRLACSRPLPVARLGFKWLQSKQPQTPAECAALLKLAEAESVAVRPELIRWLRSVLGPSPHFQSDWVIELLDSRHADVRREGWSWFVGEPRCSGDVALWQKLLESPYDDLRLCVVAMLEEESGRRSVTGAEWDRSRLDPELVRGLWATVLLNIHRGGRTKPRVVGQIAARLDRRPDEVSQLLPILAVALRSVRGPEWRTGLAALVQLVARRPELEQIVQAEFPELRFIAS